MREIREKQAANSEAPNKSRRHLPSVPKPCGIGYQTRLTLMKRFKTLIMGLLGYIKGGGIAPDTWQISRERRSQDQHVFDWYTCCVRLARLSMEICGETVRTVAAGLMESGGAGVALPCASARRSRLHPEVFDDCFCVGRRLSSPSVRAIIRELNDTVFALKFLETGGVGRSE